MAKTDVYSWRLEPRLKEDLEEAARRRSSSLSALLSRIASEWLERSDLRSEEEREDQRRRHEAAARCFGTLAGGDPDRAEEAGRRVADKLRTRHGRDG